MRGLAILVIVLSAGCATTQAPPAGPIVPDLRGTWSGTWGGTPLTVLVLEQRSGPGDSGLVIGPWQVLGERYPTLTGVITESIRGEMVSTHMDALIGDAGGGRLVVTVRARSAAGDQRLTLRLVDRDRLHGEGDSQYAWGPRGPVQLVRRALSLHVDPGPAVGARRAALLEFAHPFDGARACRGSTSTT
jgi:hypothetical protein